jgi:hypothetical protein
VLACICIFISSYVNFLVLLFLFLSVIHHYICLLSIGLQCTDQTFDDIPLSNKTHMVVTVNDTYCAVYLDASLVYEATDFLSSSLTLRGLFRDPGLSGAYAMDPTFKVYVYICSHGWWVTHKL